MTRGVSRILKIAALIILLLSSTVAIYSDSYEMISYRTAVSNVSPKVDLSFSVLSDIHTNTSNLEVAIKDLYRINPYSDAMIFNGDTVDQGIDRQYNSVRKSLEKHAKFLPPTVIKNIGNHEFLDYDNGALSQNQVKEYIDKYLDFSGEKEVYHNKWIKGYHFISLGSESGNTKELGTVKAYISVTQLKWLEERLKENYVKDKPIFVFLHQHLTSAMRGWVGTDQAGELDKILSRFPEAIVFTSHTHVSLSVNNVFSDKPYTVVHTGGVNYQLVPDNKGGRSKEQGNQGLYMEVKGNLVTIKGREFDKKEWMFEKEIAK